MAEAGFASRCQVCLGPDFETRSPDGRNVRVECATHGHFEVARELGEAIARMRPNEKTRLFFQVDSGGRRRRLRLSRGAPSGRAATPRRRRQG